MASTSTKRGEGLNGKPLRVKVVARAEVTKYKGQGGDEKLCLCVAVSDGEVCQQAKIYEKKHFTRFSRASPLEHPLRSDEGGYLVVTKFTKVFVTSGVEVPAAHEEMGVKLLNPPPAKQVTLTEALKSPQKEKISVTGMIVQEEAVKTVNVRGEDVPIKVIILEDTSKAKAKVSLWRDASMSPTRPGDFVVVTNQYRGETSLSTTNRTKVEV
ncbi:hypothetical protein MAR_021892 [Mya arenaria]|uniref:Shieldin complex subunit 2 first OB fold domain-containing protein n=1 Tax=Mya arenaria TaxID=6604 RepID=A0ABY7E963_MYAAR|nr:hypothetical protein MAR_021892 [Mya arenaria]